MNLKDFKGFFSKNKQKKYNNLKISNKDKIIFLDQLYSLLKSGIPLLNSFKIILYQTKKSKIKFFLEKNIENLNSGMDLKSSFSSFEKIFSDFDLSMIEMGEVSGKLSESIESIKNKEEKSREIKSKIFGALIYPIIIIFLSIFMIGVFLIYVIPKVEDMYKDANVNLPDLTIFVINSSNFIQIYYHFIIIFILLFLLIIFLMRRNKKTKLYFDFIILKLPILGKLFKKKILSLFSLNLGTLLENGVIINKSLEIVAESMDNIFYKKNIIEINLGIKKGLSLSHLMGIEDISKGKENFLFPIELASIVKIGEETGNLSDMLIKNSIKSTKELDNIVKNIQTAIEPSVIIFVGLIIGTLIMAILLPFFNMVNVI